MNTPKKTSFSLFFLFYCSCLWSQNHVLSGNIIDSNSHEPLKSASILNKTTNRGKRSDSLGRFVITVGPGKVTLEISMIGYLSKTVSLANADTSNLVIDLAPDAQKMGAVTFTYKKGKYRNKDNPAVELIRKVIAKKDQNRPEAVGSATFEEYDKLELSLKDVDPKAFNKRIYKPYRFMFDHPDTLAGDTSLLYFVYLEEKTSQNYMQKRPPRSLQIVTADKKVDYGDLIDTKGLSNYMNSLFTDIDIYNSNIMLFTNQFLSPVASTSPTFYEFFLGDTILSNGQKLVRLNFIPRNPDDLLFRGMFYITLDGNYAIEKVSMTISKKINLNFIKNLHIHQEFQKTPSGHYYRVKYDVSADFSLSQKGKGIHGRKLISYDHLAIDPPIGDSVFTRIDHSADANDTLSKPEYYWQEHRQEPLTPGEALVYTNVDSLAHLKTFIRTKDLVNVFIAGYKSAGKFEIGPAGTFYSFNSVEGLRLSVGGRSTPSFSKRIYLNGYVAYGFNDQSWKYNAGVAYSFNKKSVFGYPLDYIKFNFFHDLRQPGKDLQNVQANSFLASFKRGYDDILVSNDIYRLDYVKELPSHLSYDFGLEYWSQQPVGSLHFIQPTQFGMDTVTRITTTQVSALFRWAPHEKFYQGRVYRVPFVNQYPIFNFQYILGIKGLLGGEYAFHDIDINIFKRFYLSAFGYTDVNLSAGYLFGNLPFPLMEIVPANQTYVYQSNFYNLMNFAEFVSDQYVGLSLEHHFNGFIFNKIPLIRKLKWREIISAKILYGGVRPENDPDRNPSLMKFPIIHGQLSTFALGSQPYVEGGVGIGNIFKFMRVDAIERFTYLNNPMVPRYGIRFQLLLDY
jgi:hypothetical protein